MSSRSKKETFKKGDRVSARWSGSNVFYDAKVLDVTTRSYKVQFDDGSISSLRFSEVKKLTSSEESPPKPTKSKSRSRSRSTGRTTRSRSRSPARREKKAPAAKNEKKSTSTRAEKKKEETRNSNSTPKDETDTVSKSVLTREKIGMLKSSTFGNVSPVVTINSYSKEVRVSTEKSEGSTELRARSSRLAAMKSAETTQRILESKFSAQAASNAKAADKSKYSDDEEEEEEEEEEQPKKSVSKWMKTAYFLCTAFRMVLVPLSLLFLVFACTRKQCTILDYPQFYSKWRDLFNAVKLPLAGICGFHLLQVILSLIPLGRKEAGFSTAIESKKFQYRMNGFLVLSLNLIAFALCAYFRVYMNWGYDKFRPIALSSVLYCLVCALALHIYAAVKGGANAQSRAPIVGNFYYGVYTNPILFGKIDLKTSFIRAGLIGSVLLNSSIVLKFFLMKGYVTIPLALTAGMQTFFVLDLFAREEKWLSTATYAIDNVGFAFMLIFGFMIPIGFSLQNVFLFLHEANANIVPHYCSGAIVLLFFVGYYIYLTSTNLKHNFRKSPFSSTFSEIVSIPTCRKKRLIASGWWGRVRHPNYLGLLIMALAWTLPCGVSHAVPYGPLLLLAIALILRSFRIETDCREKYGPAWNNYTEKVRSRFLPYIF